MKEIPPNCSHSQYFSLLLSLMLSPYLYSYLVALYFSKCYLIKKLSIITIAFVINAILLSHEK